MTPTEAQTQQPKEVKSWFARIPERIKSWAYRVFSVDVLPNESKVRFVARKIFEIIAALFIFAATLPLMPIFFAGYLVYWLTESPKHYMIGSKETVLTKEALIEYLQAVVSNNRQLHSIEIIQAEQEIAFHLEVEALLLLRQIQPQKIILTHLNVSQLIIDQLESKRHYYLIDTHADLPRGSTQLILREKLAKYFLPTDPNEMLAALKRLVEKEVRIISLFFSCYPPEHLKGLVDKYVQSLGPPLLHCYIMHQQRECSPAELEALLH